MEVYFRLQEQGIRSIIDIKEEKDFESLFSSGGTRLLRIDKHYQ
jgi:hypothetical protein